MLRIWHKNLSMCSRLSFSDTMLRICDSVDDSNTSRKYNVRLLQKILKLLFGQSDLFGLCAAYTIAIDIRLFIRWFYTQSRKARGTLWDGCWNTHGLIVLAGIVCTCQHGEWMRHWRTSVSPYGPTWTSISQLTLSARLPDWSGDYLHICIPPPALLSYQMFQITSRQCSRSLEFVGDPIESWSLRRVSSFYIVLMYHMNFLLFCPVARPMTFLFLLLVKIMHCPCSLFIFQYSIGSVRSYRNWPSDRVQFKTSAAQYENSRREVS